ncbi:hypothetical protein [Ancylobacter mangrovi]|uniref:hypothetical protein n=1 Tax=Ancylobacter mangrovi TaxID=2972472 RepID=UPI002163DE00|nr:hypothetical protein [Ancylobacter mangrovi]MCS0501588.1 hypothetical protein [Ancylobacter mangrovi]
MNGSSSTIALSSSSMNPRDVANLLIATATENDIDERPNLLILRAALADDDLRARWLRLRAAPPSYIAAVTITEADGDGQLESDAEPGPEEFFRISVSKRQVAGRLCLFLARSMTRWEKDLATVDHVFIADMEPHETFSTYRNRLQLWTNDEPEGFAPSEPLPDPRSYVSDFTGRMLVPGDVRPWLIRGAPERVGETYAVWGILAARRLLAALSDRVSFADGVTNYHFSGPPSCAVAMNDAEALSLMPRLQEGAAWVFPDAKDADTRHLLLAAEWARTHRRGELRDLGDGALDSAKAAYAAYVKSGSKDTLKALAELRKAVVDEGQKSAQRAQELAGAMWKDVAIAALPFVLKILPDAGKASSQTTAAMLALGAVAFLVFSFGIQVFINERFFRQQKDGRSIWKREINTVLRQQDVEELSEEPLRASIEDYRRVRLAVGAVYAILIFILLMFAVSNLKPSEIAHEPGFKSGEAAAAHDLGKQD